MEEEHVASEVQENPQRKVRGSVLDHFSYISNEKEALRVKHGLFLLGHLYKNSNVNNENNEIKYALNRLVRGLGSSKNESRIGFYSTLVALLSTFPSVEAQQVLESVKKELQIGQSSSKGETGDIYTGQILACGAIIRSRLFFKATPEEQKNILEMLISAGKKRSYLASATSNFLTELVNMVDAKQFEDIIWSCLKPEILKSWPEQTLDSIYLAIFIQSKFPGVIKAGALKKNLGTREILCSDNVKPLCEILLNIPYVASLKHVGYEVISKEVAKSSIVSEFTLELDQHLTKLNRNKLIAVSIIIKNILGHLEDHSKIPDLLPKNFTKQMLQYFRNHHGNNHDQEFQEAMSQLFDALCSALQNEHVDDKIKIAVLKTLLFYPGSFMIENITKSKIVQHIIQTLKADGVKKLSKLYKDVIVAKKEKIIDDDVMEPWINSERIYAAQLLTKLQSHPSVVNELEWKVENLKLLLNMGIIRSEKYRNVGAELAGGLRDTFFRALDQKFQKLESMSTVLLELTNHLESMIASQNYEDILRTPLIEDEFDIFQQMCAITKILEARKSKNKYALVFQILFLHMGLQLFKDKELAVASLKELFMCYERVQHEKKSKSLDNDQTDDPEWIEVVVDLFLNLLSHSSHLLRNIIKCVFPYLCQYMTPSSIHQILSVLDPKNEANPLSNANECDSEESEDDEESDDNDDDDEDESANEESGSNSEFEEHETINDKLRMAVRQALGNNGYQTDEESIDLDDMSDTEGQRLDEALVQAFKQFKPNRGRNNKKQSKDAETLTHFRVRVLDLVDIYLDNQPAMLSCLEIMLPLLQTLEFTVKDEHQVPLQNRIKHCLKKLRGLKKFGSTDGITEDVLGDLLSSLMDKGTKSAMVIQDMSSELSDCCMFVIRCSQILQSVDTVPKKMKKKLREKLIDILTNAINMYFKQRDCLIPYGLFKNMFQLNWDVNLVLAPIVFEYVFNDDTRPFRRSQGLELLKLFYLNRRLQGLEDKFQKHMVEHEKQFCHKVVDMLDEFCKNRTSKTIKERTVYHIFNLLKAIATHPIKNEEIDWKQIGEKIREYRSYVSLSKDAKVAYNQLCAQLKIPNVVKMQKQTIKLTDDKDDESEELNQPQNEKKQKQKIKGKQESKKLKKQARLLRFQSLSEGLPAHFSFSDVNMNQKEENESEEETKSKKNKKQKQNVANNDSFSKNVEDEINNSDVDMDTTEMKKSKNKRLSNGVHKNKDDSFSKDQTGKSKKAKKRLSNQHDGESHNQEITPHKKKKHN